MADRVDHAGLQATEQALLDVRAQQEHTGPAALVMHRYAAAAIARNGDWRPAHQALLELHVAQTPGARMPNDALPPDDWPPSCWAPYVALKALARWLDGLGGDNADCVSRRQVVSIDDVVRRARRALAYAGQLDPGDGAVAEDIVEANERMGDSLVEIGLALGLPRPDAQTRWGAPEILARIAEWAAERPVAAAAHAYCAAWENLDDNKPVTQTVASREALFAAHRATTPSETPPTHVVVAVDELERLRAYERNAEFILAQDDIVGGHQAANYILSGGAS